MKFRIASVVALSAAVIVPSMAQTPVLGATQLHFFARYAGLGDQPVTRFIVRYKDETATTQRAGIASARISALRQVAGTDLTYIRPMSGLAHVLAVPRALGDDEARAMAQQIVASDSRVLYAEPDRRAYALATTRATASALDAVPATDQWNLMAPSGTQQGGINAVGAWGRTQGEGVTVAIVDTGVVDHADLSASLVNGAAAQSGYDFIGSDHDCTSKAVAYSTFLSAGDGDGRDGNPTDMGDGVTFSQNLSGGLKDCGVGDASWHGTHVGGIVAAVNNGIGTTGVAFKSKLLQVRVLGKGGGWDSDIADGIVWASGGTVPNIPANTNRARVINLSLGFHDSAGCTQTEQAAITAARANGAVIVAAAGNHTSIDNPGLDVPAICTGAIAVVAHGYEGDLPFYSNYGTGATISAPGGSTDQPCRSSSLGLTCVSGSLGEAALIKSTINLGEQTAIASPGGDSYSNEAGTSMAAPHVAGTAALMLSLMPSLTPDGVRDILTASARAFPTASYCNQQTDGRCGAGMLDAKAAVDRLQALIPTVAASATASPPANSQVTLTASASNTAFAGRSYTYAWTQTAGSGVSLSSASGKTVTFTAPAAGSTLSFKVTATATDGVQGSATTSVTTVAADSGSSGGGTTSSSGGGGGQTGVLAFVMLLLAAAGLRRNRIAGRAR